MFWLGTFCLGLHLGLSADQTVEPSSPYRRRYDYKQSFKFPILINKSVPGFDLHEGAKATDKFVRLSSSIPGSQGSIWTEEANQYPDWEIEYSFAVTGRGQHGKDGFAFWYTQEKAESGPVFGNRDSWNGLAIFHDTYDKLTQTVSPYILGINNDGTKEVANVTNILTQMFGGCYRDFRNAKTAVYVKISYIDNILKVAVDDKQNGKAYLPCFESHELRLSTGYYFGFSASSSYPADDHTLYHASIYEVNPSLPDRDLDGEYEREHLVDGKLAASEEELKNLETVRTQFKDWFGESDSISSTQEAQINSAHDTQVKIDEKIDQINKKLDSISKNQPASSSSSSSSSDVVKDLSNLGQKVEALTKALVDTKAKISKVQSLVQTVHQTEETDLNIISNQLDLLSNKIEEMLHHGQSQQHSVKSQLESVSSSLWNLFILAIIGGVFVVCVAIYRARAQKATKKYI